MAASVVRPGELDERPAVDQRLIDLADDVRAFVFGMLDGEIGWDGMEAGRVAAACEAAFLAAVR